MSGGECLKAMYNQSVVTETKGWLPNSRKASHLKIICKSLQRVFVFVKINIQVVAMVHVHWKNQTQQISQALVT